MSVKEYEKSTAAHLPMEAFGWYGMMLGAYRVMDANHRAEFEKWERANVGAGSLSSSDWPGWEQLIGKQPTRSETVNRSHKKSIPQTLRVSVMERDRYRCVACGTWKDLSIDHIYPESRGGETDIDNLQTLCRSCNSRKGTKA